jgi:site-specific recombinase XerD
MMISLETGIEYYLTTLATEGKSPNYIDWLRTRLRYFREYIERTQEQPFQVQDLVVEDGRGYIVELMDRDIVYRDHPNHEEKKRKLSMAYIHGCGRAIRSFSTWLYEEGYLEENVMRRLKLPKLSGTGVKVTKTPD